jgi:hypothetical protein
MLLFSYLFNNESEMTDSRAFGFKKENLKNKIAKSKFIKKFYYLRRLMLNVKKPPEST